MNKSVLRRIALLEKSTGHTLFGDVIFVDGTTARLPMTEISIFNHTIVSVEWIGDINTKEHGILPEIIKYIVDRRNLKKVGT